MTKRDKKQCSVLGCYEAADFDLQAVSELALSISQELKRKPANYYCSNHFEGLIHYMNEDTEEGYAHN